MMILLLVVGATRILVMMLRHTGGECYFILLLLAILFHSLIGNRPWRWQKQRCRLFDRDHGQWWWLCSCCCCRRHRRGRSCAVLCIVAVLSFCVCEVKIWARAVLLGRMIDCDKRRCIKRVRKTEIQNWAEVYTVCRVPTGRQRLDSARPNDRWADILLLSKYLFPFS